MPRVCFIIGATASGKSYFIDHNYAGKDVKVLNIFDYQQDAYKESGFYHKQMMPMQIEFRCLKNANDNLLRDIIEALKLGKDVVCEHTLYKAKRRIAYIDAIREAVDDAVIDIYVMCPGRDRWLAYIRLRELEDEIGSLEKNAQSIEFPNLAEGFNSIYEVSDEGLKLRMDLLLV